MTISIALGGLPDQGDAALYESLARLRCDSEIVVVVETTDAVNDVLTLREEHEFDALVMPMGQDGQIPSGADQLLGEYTDMTIVLVASDGSKAFLYELQPQLRLLETPDGSLASAVKRAVGSSMGCT